MAALIKRQRTGGLWVGTTPRGGRGLKRLPMPDGAEAMPEGEGYGYVGSQRSAVYIGFTVSTGSVVRVGSHDPQLARAT